MSAAAIGELFRAMFTTQFDKRRVFTDVADVSSELPYGDALNFPKDDDDGSWTETTLANAQGDTLSNSAWPTATIPQATNAKLDIKIHRLNRLIPNVNIVQLRPNQVQSQATFAARRAARIVDSAVRTQMYAQNNLTTRLTKVTVSAANFLTPNTAYKAALRDMVAEAREELMYNGNPDEGLVCKMSPKVMMDLIEYYEDKGIPFTTVFNDNGTVGGFIDRLYGFTVTPYVDAGPGETNGDDDKHGLYFYNPGELSGAAYARQVAQITPWDGINGGDHDGTYIRGRLYWAAGVFDNTLFRVGEINIT